MRTAIYARVSTTAHQSVEMQLRDLRELADRRGFEVVDEYCDEGVSGAKNSRPGLNHMLTDAEMGKFSIILVWKLDRLGRSLVHLVRLMEDFRRLGIELVSFSEGLDFTTTTGKLLFQIISAFAEFERDCIRERVRAGMRNAKAKGKHIGRPPRTWLSEETRKEIALAYQRGEGSLRQLAARYRTSMGTVQRCVASYRVNLGKASAAA
ncbi:MAG TPA: recombinase family protein [Candidatus Acidoferrales bacterium]|nr:recombinase family protein [Candidatus Acidoferrales bacterium]